MLPLCLWLTSASDVLLVAPVCYWWFCPVTLFVQCCYLLLFAYLLLLVSYCEQNNSLLDCSRTCQKPPLSSNSAGTMKKTVGWKLRSRCFTADGTVNLVRREAAEPLSPYITERSEASWCGSYQSFYQEENLQRDMGEERE